MLDISLEMVQAHSLSSFFMVDQWYYFFSTESLGLPRFFVLEEV